MPDGAVPVLAVTGREELICGGSAAGEEFGFEVASLMTPHIEYKKTSLGKGSFRSFRLLRVIF